MKSLVLLSLGMSLFLGAFSQVSVNASYLNITRPSGGPVVVGDVLEIHCVIAVNSGTTIKNLAFTAPIPTGTTYVAGSLATNTNENVVVAGVTNTGNYTDGSGDDRGLSSGTTVVIYLGDGAIATAGGTITGGTTQPRFYTVTTILMACYKIKVTGSAGSTISTAGNFHYVASSGSAVATNIPAITMMITSASSCSATSSTNYLTTESNGTFGSGNTQNRSSSSASVSGYTFATLGANNPSDGQYSIANNTSPTLYTGTTPASGDKVFGVWDVSGDHTGSSTGTGNAPTASGSTGGYLLAVNGTYVPAIVFHTVITGLVASNSYTVSFWVRNICPTCGCDPSTGNNNATPGVLPNLAISLNGNNYFTSGDIAYNGAWVQKSYTFVNLSSTSATIDVTNNAPGGGGNDWVMDDIKVTQCLALLPVSLESFTGRPVSSGVLLQWQTSFAADVQQFEVERSTDGTHFAAIGQVSANPDSAAYSFTDALLPPGGSFIYRLRILDINGSPEYSNVIRVNTGGSTGNLTTQLAPNPTHNSSTLSIQGPDAGKAQVALWNSGGALIWSQPAILTGGGNITDIRLPELARGIYLVKTTMSNSSTVVRLVVE
ncbi:MAG TPA: T9SS type A sorting domain-containing protein [Puia sp.]